MLHPLFSTIVQRPDLVIDHLSAYGSLFQKEATSAGSELLIRVVAGVFTLVTFIIFLGLTGIALMLGMMQNRFHWILMVVPTISLVLMIVTGLIAMRPLKTKRFPEMKAQIESDAIALRTVS